MEGKEREREREYRKKEVEKKSLQQIVKEKKRETDEIKKRKE